ncbi:MAG: V-type ATP synthase subunit F [Christensenellales bacterium]|jgi:V/A-type H+-transporting ATPase subunit F
MSKIAVIGDRDSILGFKAIGLSVYPVSDPDKAVGIIHRLARDGCSVIFITEQVAERVKETIDRYKTAPYPAIIPIPNNEGTTGFGLRGVRANVEKAIGSDIIFRGQ